MNNNKFVCLYQAPNGMSCAVGCLIKPEAYSPEMEGKGLHDTIVREALFNSDIQISDKETYRLLEELQMCHDGVEVERWEDRLQAIGRNFNLIP